ncbi:MAG: hypothetical protein CMJ82_11030 [Planctomycetaceae bacterium]|nr:hypothetical protein [Planctomycetaceae bacterium]
MLSDNSQYLRVINQLEQELCDVREQLEELRTQEEFESKYGVEEVAPKDSEEWALSELDELVELYFDILVGERTNKPYESDIVLDKISQGALSSRTKGAIFFRLKMISFVLNSYAEDYLSQFPPFSNIAPELLQQLKASIQRVSSIDLDMKNESSGKSLKKKEKKSSPTTRWSKAELEAAVDAYLLMLEAELEGKAYSKSEVNEKLRQGPLKGRTKGSVELRMGNISAVAVDLGMEIIPGYKPYRNVGKNVYAIIEHALTASGANTKGAHSESVSSLPETISPWRLIAAMEKIKASGYAPHGFNHTYEVLYEGKGYPPLAVVSFAIEELRGVTIPPGTYEGGKGKPAFKLLEDAGFGPVKKKIIAPKDSSQVQQNVGDLEIEDSLDAPTGKKKLKTKENLQAMLRTKFLY